MSENIGIMSSAYFTGKVELMEWINDFLHVNITKIEQMCTGSLHCQLLDAIFPRKMPLHKVNFHAKQEHEYVKNFKLLQSLFDREHIQKHVDVHKLIRGKYQDNLEFTQWMKNFFDVRLGYSGEDYDAVGRRNYALERYYEEHRHATRTGGAGLDGVKPLKKKARTSRSSRKPATEKKSSSKSPKDTKDVKDMERKFDALLVETSQKEDSLLDEVNQLRMKLMKTRMASEKMEAAYNFDRDRLQAIGEYIDTAGISDGEIIDGIRRYLIVDEEEFRENWTNNPDHSTTLNENQYDEDEEEEFEEEEESEDYDDDDLRCD